MDASKRSEARLAKRIDEDGGSKTMRSYGNVATSITSNTLKGAKEEILEAARAGADIVELRMDFLQEEFDEKDVLYLVRCCELPMILTYRPVWEGGNYDGPEEYRLSILRKAAESGCEYIDVELKAAESFLRTYPKETLGSTKLILSRHDFEMTPSKDVLEDWVDQAWALGADVVKIVTTAQTINDVRSTLDLLYAKKGPTISLSMGERGQISRLLAPRFGSFLTFGALSKGKESAPGQITVHDLLHTYRVHDQDEDTKIFGLIGNPVSHSKGPLLHNDAMKAAGFNGVYVPFLVEDFESFVSSFPEFSGFSVTIPHKLHALEYGMKYGKVDSVAQKIGALNTLVRRGDGLFFGCNTDCSAAINSIEQALEKTGQGGLEGKRIVVVGAGGAGRAIAFGAKEKGAEVVVVNRTRKAAEELASDVGCSIGSLNALLEGELLGDVLANTTSVGMFPDVDRSPVPADVLSSYKVVFDAIYNPMHTRLLQDASAAGCTVVNGVEMFVGQAAEQFLLFTELEPPLQRMLHVVTQSLN